MSDKKNTVLRPALTFATLGAFVGYLGYTINDIQADYDAFQPELDRMEERAISLCTVRGAAFPRVAEDVARECGRQIRDIVGTNQSRFFEKKPFTLGFVRNDGAREELLSIDQFMEAELPAFAQKAYESRAYIHRILGRLPMATKALRNEDGSPLIDKGFSVDFDLTGLRPPDGTEGHDTVNIHIRNEDRSILYSYKYVNGDILLGTPMLLPANDILNSADPRFKEAKEIGVKLGEEIRSFFGGMGPSEKKELRTALEGARIDQTGLLKYLENRPYERIVIPGVNGPVLTPKTL